MTKLVDHIGQSVSGQISIGSRSHTHQRNQKSLFCLLKIHHDVETDPLKLMELQLNLLSLTITHVFILEDVVTLDGDEQRSTNTMN
jgi:hypothetical protein